MYPRSVKVRKGTHTIRCIIDASSPGINALTDEDKEREEKKTELLDKCVAIRGAK